MPNSPEAMCDAECGTVTTPEDEYRTGVSKSIWPGLTKGIGVASVLSPRRNRLAPMAP